MYGEPRIQITPAIAQRLIDLIGVRHSIPVAPLPGEGLPDLIFRAAGLNGLSSTASFFAGHKIRLSHHRMAMASVDTSSLANILGCPFGESDLERLVYFREEQSVRCNRLVSFFGSKLSSKQLITHRRVAPRSLAKSNHSRAIWHIKALSFDPKSHEQLIERCPRCHELLDFWRPAGISRCWFCGPTMDLRNHPQPIVETDDPKGLRFVTSLIDPEAPVDVSSLHTDLRNIGTGELFMLCVFIAAALDEERCGARSGESFTNMQVSPANLALAGRALINWPHGFAQLGGQLAGVPTFRSKALQRDPLVHYLNANGNFQISTVTKVNDALLLPRLNSPTLADEEEVAAETIDQVSLVKLHRYARRRGPIRGLSESIGMPQGVLFECLVNGSLPCPDARLAAALNVPFDRTTALSDLVKAHPKQRKMCLPVQSVVSALYRGEANPWPTVLDAIRAGLLPVVRASSKTWLGSLQVQDFAPWVKFCSELSETSTSPAYPLVNVDMAFYLDLGYVSLPKALIGDQTTTLKHLSDFRRHYVFANEVGSRLLMLGYPRTKNKLVSLLTQSNVSGSDQYRSLKLRPDVERFISACQRTGVNRNR